MSEGASRLGDKAQVQQCTHGCPGCPHPGVGPAISGSNDVFFDGLPAVRVDDVGLHAACCGANMWAAAEGSSTVFVNGKPVVRRGDKTRHCGGQGKMIEGSSTVFVGGSPTTSGNRGGVGEGDAATIGGGDSSSSSGAGGGAARHSATSTAARGTHLHARNPPPPPPLKSSAPTPTSSAATGPTTAAKPTCNKVALFSNAAGVVFHVPGEDAIFYTAHMEIDADGAPNAYHPNRHNHAALDFLDNAGHPGNWYGLAKDAHGNPYIQQPGNPAKHPYPGFYVSQTPLTNPQYPDDDVRHHVDASTVPYIVLPLRHPHGCQLGDLAAVCYAPTEDVRFAVYADKGPPWGLGESSIALAASFGFSTDLRWRHRQPRGKPPGVDRGVIFVVFKGSSRQYPWPLSNADIDAKGRELFDRWGSIERLKCCFPAEFKK